ncbi:hypothetical protein O181_021344 [Austropuccinia psidii MF-1]|uniref:Sodium/nucleoside cotransporter n=1 Tax=Austropuccinia psidii MF-1 TaxID=1389203 RepID=A0A9Q3GWL8_9BASI|nr:hypothetical protein [Austropuccinia psidii MF-1]
MDKETLELNQLEIGQVNHQQDPLNRFELSSSSSFPHLNLDISNHLGQTFDPEVHEAIDTQILNQTSKEGLAEETSTTELNQSELNQKLFKCRQFSSKFLNRLRLKFNSIKKQTIHFIFVIILLSWWITGISLEKTRQKWVVVTILTWLILISICFHWLSFKSISKKINHLIFKNFEAQKQEAKKPKGFLQFIKFHQSLFQFFIGGLILCFLWLMSIFLIDLKQIKPKNHLDRLRSLLGLIIFQFFLWLSSKNKKLIRWKTVFVGLLAQQILALLVLKTKAGFDFFNWIAIAMTDLLQQGTKAAAFFFSPQVIENHWFFVNSLAATIFFVALVRLLYYLGAMNQILTKFAWVFYTFMGVSGAEAIAAAASPFVGQAESVVLVEPFLAYMTPSEFHQVMTSGFATIAGSVLAAYVALGMPAVYLISASIMSIPASLSISKLRFPEDRTSLTAGELVIPSNTNTEKDANALQAFSNGSSLGLKVAGMILANVLTVLGLLYTVNGALTWIGQFWGIDPNGSHPLTLQLILQYVFYPISWLMGTPEEDVLKVSRLLALKMISNEFVAYQELSRLMPEMTERGSLIAVFSLCGFANLSSLGIQIGALNSLAPSQSQIISQVSISALICGFFSTIQTAAIAGMIY